MIIVTLIWFLMSEVDLVSNAPTTIKLIHDQVSNLTADIPK